MAYEWIKIEVVTPDKPEIYQLAEILAIDPDAVLGKLIRIWAWADQQTIDGNASSNATSVTKSAIDRITFMSGFADALLQVGWLRYDGTILIFPNFERHNGKSSKKRTLTNRRVTEHREMKSKGNAKCNVESVTAAFQKALPEVEVEVEVEVDLKDKKLLSEQPRTEDETESDKSPAQETDDKKPDPVDLAFEGIFWIAGLRKDAKVKAKSAFKTKYREYKTQTGETPDQFATLLADDIRSRLTSGVLGTDKLLPTSYLNGERWNDENPVNQPINNKTNSPAVFQGPSGMYVDFDKMGG
ncbi:hypothetical protein [Yersinia sp. 2105 StPb PI]|uniref:hypothetical protein n=1 Tax=Yersinia sp. 2105 StPb PI TaxID=2507058 RepID=UPI001F500729|nr:hypothetical protein [Yersinia sp. 2105 StPb PI]